MIDGKGITVREWLKLEVAKSAAIRKPEQSGPPEVSLDEDPVYAEAVKIPASVRLDGAVVAQAGDTVGRRRMGVLPWLVVGAVLAGLGWQGQVQKVAGIDGKLAELATLQASMQSQDYRAGLALEVLGRLQLGDAVGLGQMAQEQRTIQAQVQGAITVLSGARRQASNHKFMCLTLAVVLGGLAVLKWAFGSRAVS